MSTLSQPAVNTSTRQLESSLLKRSVDLRLYSPSGWMGHETLHLLLVNDGQDLAQMQIEHVLQSLYENWQIEPVLVVGIDASAERLQDYGVANRPDFKKRGANAHIYADFIIRELIPFLQAESGAALNGKRAFAGFSLGGLSAFDIVWNHPEHFDHAGVFSGSFWWRKKDLKAGYTDKDRILHQMIRDTKKISPLKFWLMTGTEDELSDRNQNFIIDSIDDTIDVIKELQKKGYKRPQDIFYYEKVGGKHDVATWAAAMPAFLIWAFGK